MAAAQWLLECMSHSILDKTLEALVSINPVHHPCRWELQQVKEYWRKIFTDTLSCTECGRRDWTVKIVYASKVENCTSPDNHYTNTTACDGGNLMVKYRLCLYWFAVNHCHGQFLRRVCLLTNVTFLMKPLSDKWTCYHLSLCTKHNTSKILATVASFLK